MKYSVAALLAVVVVASASYSNQTIVYTTEIVDVYETICPASATITYGGVTYINTKTESATVTITNCPCTVSKPVYTTSSVHCNTCAIPTTAPVYPNSTVPTSAPGGAVGTTYAPSASPSGSPIPPASGASKMAMSGAGLAGLLGLAAFFL